MIIKCTGKEVEETLAVFNLLNPSGNYIYDLV
jgi:hypothetical protein